MKMSNKRVLTDAEKIAAWEKSVEVRTNHNLRRNAKISIILKKAEAAKITCSEAEVDAELKRLGKK